jgi:hypothetical protein
LKKKKAEAERFRGSIPTFSHERPIECNSIPNARKKTTQEQKIVFR